ncbi:hypothetical protein CLV84_0626 [Neolewinella xylanilytica]|uniref:Lipoprotein n=1 Tax=Neolewinella xylanilytica TaxID=1514080 RepID=A0A2S6I864_9BACT|nr:hypothetical protein [Neolewinella xylanilytica]PPK87678.1 hypothetical protein CLV84_0626 [Neolewinella xylanilytica]
MRTILYPILLLLLVASCSKQRQTLNRIEGTFETVEFVVTVSGTDSVLFTASPTFQFGECAPRDTRCTMTVVDSDSTVYNYRYNYSHDPASGMEVIGFNRGDAETWSSDADLSRVLDNVFDFELNKGELRLHLEDYKWMWDSMQGYDLCDISITAVKR